ncbi:MAG: CHAD domain-containing protein, partial [Methylocystis sp.]|nr:CHAD domain-containing protein [Methylocystis sp.]
PARRIRSIRFDTAANDLRKQNVALRGYELRGARFLELTWATPAAGGAVSRGAIEVRVPTLELGATLLDKDASGSLRRLVDGRPLEARCVSETERRERLLDLPRARIAVIFEKGFVEWSGERTPFNEIEFQLASGEMAAFHEFIADVAGQLPVRLVSMSETESAFLQVSGCSRAPVKARPLTLSRYASLDAAICLMLGACLDQFVANWPALTKSNDPEAIHQMRVALRRLRAALALLKNVASCPELERAGRRAKELAATLGEAREWDVFGEMLETGPRSSLRNEPSFYSLLDAVERRRLRAHEKAQALVKEPRTTRFVLDLRSALARFAWRPGASITAQPPLRGETARPGMLDTARAGSARDFAIPALDGLHRRALKRCRRLASKSTADWHKARIALKKSRYAGEFFQSLFESFAGARAYMRALAKIQDDLGVYNDMSVAARLLREIDSADGATTAVAAGFALGWYTHAQERMKQRVSKIQKSMEKLEPFWR